MSERTRRIIYGCGAGCLLLIVLFVGSCVAFQRWLESPGDLMEPQALFDPEATGFLEMRLELDNPGTESMAEAFIELTNRPPRGLTDIPIMGPLIRWNQRRQANEIRQIFPSNLAWTVYPAEDPSAPPETFLGLSMARASHSFRLMDWAGGWVLRFTDAPVVRYRDEQMLRLEERSAQDRREPGDSPAEAGELPVGFVRSDGLFYASSEATARRGLDRLLDGAADDGRSAASSRLTGLFAALDDDAQIRGVFDNADGQVLQLVEHLAVSEEPLDPAIRSGLLRAEAATVEGRFTDAGDALFELRLLGELGDLRQPLDELLSDRLRRLRDREVPCAGAVTDDTTALAIELRCRDVPRVLREMPDRMQRRSLRQRESESVPAPEEGTP